MSEEEKEAIISLKKYLDFRKESEYYGNDYEVETLINLVEKQQKEIEEKQTIIYAGVEKVKELEIENEKIRDWKYTIDSFEDLDLLKSLDVIKIKDKEYISKKRIEDKLEGLKEKYNSMCSYILGKRQGKAMALFQQRVNEEIIQFLEELLRGE